MMETVTIEGHKFIKYDGELFPCLINEEAVRIARGSQFYGDVPMVANHSGDAPMVTKMGWDEVAMKYRTLRGVASYARNGDHYEIQLGLKLPNRTGF